jgi:hypothetical protein
VGVPERVAGGIIPPAISHPVVATGVQKKEEISRILPSITSSPPSFHLILGDVN